MSRMLSTHLYYRRSFPFYTFNIVGGLDEEGVSVSAGVFFFLWEFCILSGLNFSVLLEPVVCTRTILELGLCQLFSFSFSPGQP